MLALKEGLENMDNKKILSALEKLRKISKNNKINKKTFELLIKLITMPNEKILNYALSILANCCLSDTYRRMFKELKGVPHAINIINSVNSNSIICRACRLIGNLAHNKEVNKELKNHNVALPLIKLMEKNEELASDTFTMVFRAFKKIGVATQIELEAVPDELILIVSKHLDNENELFVFSVLESLVLITNCKNFVNKKKLKISKEFFFKLIDLSKNKNLNCLIINCLSNLIWYWTSSVWAFLEGSKISEVFIEYFQNNDNISERTYKAFYKLCTEGAIRSKVKESGLLLKFIESSNGRNEKNIIAIFSLFQYDLASIKVCSENQKFISILIKNIELPESVQILGVLSRFTPPTKKFVSNNNLDALIKNKKCHGILKNVISTPEFLGPIILAGKVWPIEKAGCKMENICNLKYIENLLIQLLTQSKDKKCKEEVSLAAPFLVEAGNFEFLINLFIKYGAMYTVIDLLQRNPVEEKILAAIVRLIAIFKKNYHTPENFFQDLAGGEDAPFLTNDMEYYSEDSVAFESENLKDRKIITFEFDDGQTLCVEKNRICSKSPVLNSMLNGQFIEAKQDKIRLKNCTQKSFLLLVNHLNGQNDFSNVEIETYLELLSLSDRFLLLNLNVHLATNFKITSEGCTAAYKWYRQAGHTKNIGKIGQKIYECIFSSAENLLNTMKDELCRSPLVEEISTYLSNFIKDLSSKPH